MRILLDTNILIHREARTVVRDDIGVLFAWLDRLKHDKCIHPASVAEIKEHADPEVVKTLRIKLGSYHVLKSLAKDNEAIVDLRRSDKSKNDTVDTDILRELAAGRVDALISEDRGIHRKASKLGISETVYTIEGFLEKVTIENPEQADYRVLSVRRVRMGEVDISAPFFDSFREDYPGFDAWFARKADEWAYACTADDSSLVAFLYLKREGPEESYADCDPPLKQARRLKIGTFKVTANGYKLGERFLKIIVDNALRYSVDEIYVTIFRDTAERERLARLLEDWGFVHHGYKHGGSRPESILVRDFRPQVDREDPRKTYPYLSAGCRKYIVSIYPAYHTELLPDSVLRTESPEDFVDNRPNRNAISKVFVSRSVERDLKSGDIIVFYRTRVPPGSAHYTSVATTLGVVQGVVTDITDLDTFIHLCRRRSVFTDEELSEHWNYWPSNRPFVVNFLYVYSFPTRPNLKALKEAGVITEAPRGFERLDDEAFSRLLELADADRRLIVG